MPEISIIQDAATLRAAVTLFREAMFGLPGGITPVEDWVENYIQPGRVYGAWQEGTLAGTVNSFESQILLPGGEWLPHAAVTHVGVLPQFSRRGILRSLISRQLNDLHQNGVAIASLRASQGNLYQRFGYGMASRFHSLTIDKQELKTLPDAKGDIQVLSPAQAWPVLKNIVDRYPSLRAGSLSRWPQWWAMQQQRVTHSPLNHYVAVYLEQGEPQAFVRYHAQPDDNWLGSKSRTLVVDDLYSRSPEHYHALVSYLFRIDITRFVTFSSRPIDDPLPLMLDNPRAATIAANTDETWLRIIDVEAALNARHLQGTHSVTLTVTDPLLQHNNATWQWGPEGIQRTHKTADLSLSIDALSMLLLGGTRVWQLAQSHNITVHHSPAVKQLDDLLAVHEQPWSGVFF